jgi:hypothetical protein
VLEDRTVFSANTYLVNLVGDAGSGSGTSGDIRYCINQADNPANAGSTITFDTSALGSNNITLTKGQLLIADNMTITGPGASKLTLSGNNASRVFNISATTAQVTISGLTISSGSAAYGGGIVNLGSLTVSDCALSANAASSAGGAICNIGGTLTVSGSSLSGNSATASGGGVSNSGTATLSNSTLSGNSALLGGGVLNYKQGATLTVNESSAVIDNTAAFGGGIWNNSTVTVSASTLSANSATEGGGVVNIGTLRLDKSTLSGNSAQYVGGLFNASGTATLTNATIAQNSASISVGGIDAYSGDVLLHNTLVAGNVLKNASVDKPSDVAYRLDSASDYNLIGDGHGGVSTSNHNLLGSSSNPLNPLLATLGNYGGPTQTMALLPGSPAIDAGSSTYGGNTDQRAEARVGATDIGAFESLGFTLAVSIGNNQSAIVTNAFADPLVVSVTANNSVEPVAGGAITFTSPTSGASAAFDGSPATIGVDGKASVTAAANNTAGTYTVSASADGISSPAKFSLGNNAPPNPVVTTLLDGNNPGDTISLRQAIVYADALSGPQTITFDLSILTKNTGNVIDLQSALPDLKGNITIEGPGANVLTVQRDAKAATFRVFTVDAGAKATISGLTISGGSVGYGSGIHNAGSLTVSGDILSANSAGSEGGAVFNASVGTLTVNDSTLSGNTASRGGGIYNAGSLTVSDSTLSGNYGQDGGGGIDNKGSLTVRGSTVSDNGATGDGGGIYNAGSLTVSDSTLSSNNAWVWHFRFPRHVWYTGEGGGIYNNAGSVTISHSTLSGNASSVGDGIGSSSGDVLLHNTLIAGNQRMGGGSSEVYGNLDSASDYNLIGDGTGGLNPASHNLLGSYSSLLDPLLAPLGSYGGPTQTMALLPGSPAIDAGSSTYGGNTDQRGEARVGATDIGAFESLGFTLAVSSGNNQSAPTYTAFAQPLVVAITAKNAVEPVAGGAITFTSPASGASAAFDGSPATIGVDGKASVTAAANGTTGTYMVSASATGVASQAKFSLSNTVGPTSFVVTTLLDAIVPSGQLSLREAIEYAETLSGAQTITFEPSILTKPTGNIIDLQSALPDLKGNITIKGPGASVLTANGGGSSVFTVDAGATAAISGLTISGGDTTGNGGGGIHNAGSLTVSGCTVSDNLAQNYGGPSVDGGGIYNSGTMTISESTISDNSAWGDGGGIYNAGSLTVSDCTLADNTVRGQEGISFIYWGNGGGIYNAGSLTVNDCTLTGNSGTEISELGGGICNTGSLTVSDCTFSANSAPMSGGGIWNNGTLTVSDSTLSGNNGPGAGGILNEGSLMVSDSTLSGNSASAQGGGIDNLGGNLTVSDSTLSGNSGGSGGGIWNGDYFTAIGTAILSNTTLADNSATGGGGGILVGDGDVLLHNTLIAGNQGDVSGSLDSASDYNLIGDGSGGLDPANHNLLGSASNPLNPLLAPLGNYGGPTQTRALLPGSPAINAGSSSYGGSTDQRGKPNVGATDIGAFESQGFSVAVGSGTNQSAAINTAFANPLVVSVTAKNAAEPVAGGAITFTAPGSGASAVLAGSPTIGSDGKASVTATANGTTGTYTVSAAASGIASPAKFTLTNTAPASPTITPLTLAATTMAAAPSPQETSDQLWAELGRTWDLLLAGDNVHLLRNNPQTGAGF